MREKIEVRYAVSDQDIVDIHRFLCVIAGPKLPGAIDPKDSIEEVWRVVKDEVAVMAFHNNELVGTLGLINPKFWWGKVWFLASRWMFAIPGSRAWKPMLREAKAIAIAADLECHIISEDRGKVLILNKSRLRAGPPPLASNLVH